MGGFPKVKVGCTIRDFPITTSTFPLWFTQRGRGYKRASARSLRWRPHRKGQRAWLHLGGRSRRGMWGQVFDWHLACLRRQKKHSGGCHQPANSSTDPRTTRASRPTGKELPLRHDSCTCPAKQTPNATRYMRQILLV